MVDFYYKNMTTIKQILSSRTVWTVIVIFIINGVAGIRQYIPADWLPVVNGILSLLAIYFRIDQKTDFKE